MNDLAELRRRKAELKAQIEQQREGLKKTLLEAREEIEPANLLKKAVSGLFDPSKNKTSTESTGILGRLPAPVALLADIFIRDPKWAFLIKIIAPTALKFLPKNTSGKAKTDDSLAEKAEKSMKSSIYGRLRRGISTLRGHLKKAEEKPAPPTEQTAT